MDSGVGKRGQGVAQRGSAVIAALLIVAVVTVIAASLMARQMVFVRSVQSDQTRVQARLLLHSGLDWAMAVLREDGKRTPIIRLDGSWAAPVGNTRFGDEENRKFGVFSGRIEDAQGKFNLRNVIHNGAIDPDEIAAFVRLCVMVGVPGEVANRIVQRIIVAQPRSGDVALPAGADGKPSSVAAAVPAGPSSIAQAPMIRTLDDLRPVPGVDAHVLALLRPVVTVLPANTWINANTAGPEVLAAWVPGLSVDQAKALVSERDRGNWFVNQGDFMNRLRRPDLPEGSVRIGVTSDWFLVLGAVSTERSTIVMQALLQRGRNNDVHVLWAREGG